MPADSISTATTWREIFCQTDSVSSSLISRSLDAMAHYQICNLVLMVQLQDPHFAEDEDAKMTSVTGLTAFTLAVLYLRHPFLEAGGSDREIEAFLTGASMGGHITAVAIEQYAKTYDGALPICGVLADFEQFDFLMDFNVSAQQLALGSSSYPVELVPYIFGTVPQIKAALEELPDTWPFTLSPAGMNHSSALSENGFTDLATR